MEHKAFGVGAQLPAYPQCFFFSMGPLAGKEKDGGWFNCRDPRTGKVMRYSQIEESERGTLQGYLASLVKVARAVGRLHSAGLAHADLSERNVLIDPVSGRAIIIDLDSLVVTGLYPPDVIGTPGYIAPEVMATKHLALQDPVRKHPCAETDKYALAVMIYKYLLERHPLEGQRIIQGVAADKEEESLYGEKAVYSEHPTDSSNRPQGSGYLAANILGDKITALFNRAFVEGLQLPMARPTSGEWVAALCQAVDLLLACPNRSCTHKFFVLRNRKKPVCPYCKAAYRGTFSVMKLTHGSQDAGYRSDDGEMILNGFVGGSGTAVYKFHTHRDAVRGPGQDNNPVAQVVFLEQPAPAFYLQNLRLPGMTVRLPQAGQKDFVPIPLAAKLQLTTGLEVRFGTEPDARLGTVETLHWQ